MDEVATKAKDSEEDKVEVELSEYTVTLEWLINTRECVVP